MREGEGEREREREQRGKNIACNKRFKKLKQKKATNNTWEGVWGWGRGRWGEGGGGAFICKSSSLAEEQEAKRRAVFHTAVTNRSEIAAPRPVRNGPHLVSVSLRPGTWRAPSRRTNGSPGLSLPPSPFSRPVLRRCHPHHRPALTEEAAG